MTRNIKYYRDLTRPMGAQNPKRLNLYIDRFQNCIESNQLSIATYHDLLEDPDSIDQANEVLETITDPYYYGSHYSTPLGCVLHFLLRQEPFTYLHVLLQDHHFDVCDRLFHSVAMTARGCYETLPEIKELTPEWFYNCEFLRNRNHHRFGTKQDGEDVDDVVLPVLADNITSISPEQFVSRSLQAFEGPISTTLLSDWIDLIFGYKQQGDEAVKNYNLFYYLTYPDNVDITGISDPETRKGVITQVAHFGQCPAMLFDSAHPTRRPGSNLRRSLRNTLLQSDRKSMYNERSATWIGNTCRIHMVSDYDMSTMNSVQSILGKAEYYDHSDCYFDERSIYCCRADEARFSNTIPTITCPSTSLAWPPFSHYPWRVMIDCTDYAIVSSLKVVFESRGEEGEMENAFGRCITVEYSGEEGTWKTVTNSR